MLGKNTIQTQYVPSLDFKSQGYSMINHQYSLKERKLQREIKREEERKQRELGEGDSVADKAAAGTKTNYFDIAEGIKDSGGKKKANTKDMIKKKRDKQKGDDNGAKN